MVVNTIEENQNMNLVQYRLAHQVTKLTKLDQVSDFSSSTSHLHLLSLELDQSRFVF